VWSTSFQRRWRLALVLLSCTLAPFFSVLLSSRASYSLLMQPRGHPDLLPLTSKIPETFLLSLLVSLLAIAPLAITIPVSERFIWLRLFSSLSYAHLTSPPIPLLTLPQASNRSRARTCRSRAGSHHRLLGRRVSHSS
jgi:hypothetical protein